PTVPNVASYLAPLLSFAQSVVPESQQSRTPIYLLATAGMRLVPEPIRSDLLEMACQITSQRYAFSIEGGCERQFRVISGELEGVLGWVTTNYLVSDGFSTAFTKSGRDSDLSFTTYGFMELGGGSAQVAVEVVQKELYSLENPADKRKRVILRTDGGQDFEFAVDVSSLLGFGVNEARRSYVDWLIPSDNRLRRRDSHLDQDIQLWLNAEAEVPLLLSSYPNLLRRADGAPSVDAVDPCLPRGITVSVLPTETKSRNVTGSGSLDQCMNNLKVMLSSHETTDLPCEKNPSCLLGHIRSVLSSRDFRGNNLLAEQLRIIGTSEFYYTTEAIFGLGGLYSYQNLYDSATAYCSLSWSEILERYEPTSGDSRRRRAASGHILVDHKRLQLQCFRAAWLMTLLHDGFGIPKVTSRSDDGPSNVDVATGTLEGSEVTEEVTEENSESSREGWSLLSSGMRKRRRSGPAGGVWPLHERQHPDSPYSDSVATTEFHESRSAATSTQPSDQTTSISLTTAAEIDGLPISWTLG
ncbi:Golgi apyrase, partial [Cladochytrium tenue]